MKEFDYSPLVQPLTEQDLAAVRKWNPGKIFSITFGAFLILLPLILVITLGGPDSLIPGLIGAALLAAFGVIIYISSKMALERIARLHKFATVNNLKLIRNVTDFQKSGMIFGEGHSRKIEQELSGVLGRPYAIGTYQYVTGSGKNSQTHNYGYMQLTMPRRLPHMVLDAKKNNFWKMSNLPKIFNKDQVLSLEGDFDNYFTLYAPKEYERDALYVFTPDVMQHLIQHGQEFDMEIIDDQLFVYSSQPFAMEREEVLRKLFTVISKIGDELGAQTDYYADENIGDRSVNLVAPQGARLKSGVNWVVIVIVVIYFGFYFSGFIIDIFSSSS